MACCCNKIYKFCKAVNGCNHDNFAALFASVPDGNYTIQLDYLNSVVSIGLSIAEGVVTFTSTVQLNENFTYTGQLLDESGAVVPLVFGEESYDCFQFTTAGYFAPVDTPPEPGTQYIQDVIAGDNVSIDKTNPKKPVINATGGGAGDVNKAYVDAADEALGDAIALKEDAANKVNNLNIPNSTTFPTTQAVSGALAEKADLVSGKIPTSQLPDAILGQVHYKGLYSVVNDVISSHDIIINGQPLPAASAANVGWYFICTDGGTVGGVYYEVGDWIISNGDDGWAKMDNTDAVSSVNGKVGNVVLNKGDIGLGNVPNVDATNPANISQGASYRFVSDTEKAAWNGKFAANGGTIFGQTKIQSGLAAGTLVIGADLNATTLTNNVRKLARITSPVFNDVTKTMMLIAVDNTSSSNVVYFGGSPSASVQGANNIFFYICDNPGDNGGVERMRIDSTGVHVDTGIIYGRLVLLAGSTAAGTAPIKIKGGALMITPEPYAVETDGTDLYWTNSAGIRKKITLT